LLGGIIAARWGWKHAFGLVALPGFIIAALFLFVKDYKTVDLSFVDKDSNKIKMEKKDMVREFLTRPSVLLTYLGMAAVVFVTTSMLTWLPTYFEKTRGISAENAGKMAGSVMVLALIGAPLGGFLTDYWRKSRPNARLLFPALTTFISAIILFVALKFFTGSTQYIILLLFGVMILTFIAGAVAVTQDVIHPGLRATSYAIAVVVQNLLGASMAPIVLGKIYDLSNIQTALSVLPFVLIAGSLLFLAGSRYYVGDMQKVTKINLEAATA
jgi:fucose permease